MSKKVLKLAGKRPMLLAIIVMATFTLGLLFTGWLTPTPVKAQSSGGNPQPYIETNNCPNYVTNPAVTCPSITNYGAISTNYFCMDISGNTNRPIVLPLPGLAIIPGAAVGSMVTNITETCSNIVTSSTNTITLSFGALIFNPNPTNFNPVLPGQDYSSACSIVGTSSDTNHCSSQSISYGTVTWHVLKTNQSCSASGSATLNAYFLSDGVGYRLYTHTLRESYTKAYFCDDPKEKWLLSLSSASMAAWHMDDTYTWTETHQYSFQSAPVGMGPLSGSNIGPEGTDFLELASGIWVLPQSGLSGTGQAYLTWQNDDGAGTPGYIIYGGTITVSIQ
jgi:hypothetical protein